MSVQTPISHFWSLGS